MDGGSSSSRGGDSIGFSLDSASFDSGASISFDSADGGGSSVSFDSTDGGGVEADERELIRRKRISDANSGKTPWNKGRKHSPGACTFSQLVLASVLSLSLSLLT